MPTEQTGASGIARRNELLIRVRRPLDMALQVAASVAVALLLDGLLSPALRIGYVAATVLVVGIQYVAHRAFLADRDRRRRAALWHSGMLAVYALNGLLFGAVILTIARLPYDASALLALMCLMGMVVSVSLTVAVQLSVSAIVILPALLPGILVLGLTGDSDQRLLALAGTIMLVLLVGFSFRLNSYYHRTSELVERLRVKLQDRTRTSAHAEEAQRRLRSILDTAPFPIVVARRHDGAFLYSNRPAAELFGIRDGGAGPGSGGPGNEKPGSGKPGGGRFMLDPVHRTRIFESTVRPDEELQLATAEGAVIWATMAAVPMRYGDDDAALVVVNDITARKASELRLREAEQRLSDALAMAPDGVALFDADERLVICNSAYANIIGVTLRDAAGMTHDEICALSVTNRPDPAQAGVQTDYADWVATRRRTFKAASAEPHIFYDPRDRRWRQIRDFRLASGGTASLITDITALKRSERELRAANDSLAARTETLEAARVAALKAHQDAEYANRAKSQFLAHMSHELRTPLNAIIGFSEIMSLQLLGASGVPQYNRYASDILAAGRHLLAVIDDILDLSKVEAGKMKLVPEYLSWTRLAEDCMTLLRPLAADRLVTVAVDPAAADTTLFADERLAKQILVNLLSNAVKYTPTGGEVHFGIATRADGAAVVTVADTGVGMDEADVEKALEPFGRIDSALVSQMRGTGLGLPLVKALIEMHGGRLEIDSARGRGTTVRLHFPPGPRPPDPLG
jgi:signal transduction histidine kinase